MGGKSKEKAKSVDASADPFWLKSFAVQEFFFTLMDLIKGQKKKGIWEN